jgi:glutamyl-tRNA synthetase
LSQPVRVRFAPSPTGYLHVGGARTALFNWLYARHTGGTFVLRIEDTDQARSTEASVTAILDGLNWLGLSWDEGPGKEGPHAPYFQTQRLDTYKAHADKLVAAGRAYRCYLSTEDIEKKRAEQSNAGIQPRYDRAWSQLDPATRAAYEAEGRPSVLRFKAPDGGSIVVDDLIHGPVSFEAIQMVDDFVLVKTDGIPTYNFAVVVDDATMGITHVLRGDDHLSNTPKQIALYEALGLPLPRFGHIPMILGADKARLSKRHGATSVMQYADDGFLPEALANYLVRLGWSHGDQEIFSMEEMIQAFDVPGINKTAAVFDTAKLEWLNAHYLKTNAPESVLALLEPRWKALGFPYESWEPARRIQLVKALVERSRTLVQLAESSRFFFPVPIQWEAEATAKFLTPAQKPILEALLQPLTGLEQWDHDGLESVFKGLAGELGLKLGAVIQPARVAVTGSTASPGMYETLAIMGRELTLGRLHQAIALTEKTLSV